MRIIGGAFVLCILLSGIADAETVEVYPKVALGLVESMAWCEEGLMAALQKSITTLVNHKVSPLAVEELKGAYFEDRAVMRRRVLEGVVVPAETRLMSEVRRSIQRQASPLDTVMSIMPILSDILLGGPLDRPEELSYSDRLRSYTDRICRLSDIEAESSSLVSLHTPYSCALADLIFSAIVCSSSSSKIVVDPEGGCVAVTRSDIIPSFPGDTFCKPGSLSLQAEQEAFCFNDPELHVNIDLVNLSPNLPEYIPDSVRQAELLSYLALFRADQVLGAVSRLVHDHSKCSSQALIDADILPGWSLVTTFIAVEVDNAQPPTSVAVPVAAFLSDPAARCRFALAIRGSRTMHESTIAFDSSKTVDAILNGSHSGVQTFVTTLLPPLTNILSRESEKQHCSCQETHLTVFGHSLGASIGQMISLALAIQLKDHKQCDIQIDGVFFAPMRVFNRKHKTDFARLVNARIIIDINDPLYHIPCFERNALHGQPRCPSHSKLGINHVGSFSKSGRAYYAENNGLILLDVDYRGKIKQESQDELSDSQFLRNLRKSYPFLMTVVSTLLPSQTLGSLPRQIDFSAAHSCSHACALSAACTDSRFRWWCEDCYEAMSS